MKIQALDNFTATWFEPEDQEGDPVRFRIRPLDGEQYAQVAEHMRREGNRTLFTAAAEKLALRFGLVDWDGLKTPAGVEIPHGIAEHKRLPFVVRKIVFAEIMNRSSLSEADEKNFESPSRLREIEKVSTA